MASTTARERSLFASVAPPVLACRSLPFRRTRPATLHWLPPEHRLFAARWSLTVYSRSSEDWSMREFELRKRLANQLVERTGMSRSAQCRFQRQWRLIPVAHLVRQDQEMAQRR